MGNAQLRLVSRSTVNRTVTPRRCKNAELRTREHLTASEVEKLMEAAKGNRYGVRAAAQITPMQITAVMANAIQAE